MAGQITKSTAGILLREFHTPLEAYKYAASMASRLQAMQNAMCMDYIEAKKQIKERFKLIVD